MEIKAIVVDLDRTLLRSDKTISPYTAAVLARCRAAGMQVMAATARPQRTAEPFRSMVEFDAMAVSNGARVLCGGRRMEFAIHPDSAQAVLLALQARPALRITLETGDRAYSNLPIEEYETTICTDLRQPAREEGALKILAHLDAEGDLRAAREAMTADLYHTVAHGRLFQMMDRRATKWNGVAAMLEACGCTPEQAAYFGDDEDDIEPLKRCGLGVAVANAIDAARAAADCIAGSNDADGPACFIESKLLRG